MARPPLSYVPGLKSRKRTWHQKWYYLPDDERAQLRARYNNDKDAYFAAFRLTDAEQETMVELGMAAFVKLEAQLSSQDARISKRNQLQTYQQQAKVAMKKLGRDSSTPDPIFVAIDFEGTIDMNRPRGVTELGLARLDMKHPEEGIQGSNIATAHGRSRRDYLFKNHMRIDKAQLPAMIVSHLSDRKIILIGHSISNELATMKHLGVPVENLPNVIGVVDTLELGSAEFGTHASLQSLMDLLQIPYEPDTFHCGGNDAYYTMQVFLALLVRREEQADGLVDGRLRERVRELAWAKAPLKREIRRQMDEEAASLDLENYSGFGDLFGDPVS